jgi:hypothetical protein
MIATAEHHVRVMRHLMEYAGLSRDRAEFLAVEAWAAVAPIVEDTLLAERDELREALRERMATCSLCRHSLPKKVECGMCVRNGALLERLSRHPSQPVKGTPGG